MHPIFFVFYIFLHAIFEEKNMFVLNETNVELSDFGMIAFYICLLITFVNSILLYPFYLLILKNIKF
ncbi:hypothetical protein HMPREF0661_02045 [Prevotella melaninogenica DNF00666]|uniref:Uncharacterized protein n=1 Tax=Prevotella melaninogenica DNF00666 TaxID=1401073 RepID=A0A096DB31_9BACT|nr:hypothetical protein HMPREF0661_02045 [Prevotella melaninogenica DNF00666]